MKVFWVRQDNGQMSRIKLDIKKKVIIFWKEDDKERPQKGWKVKTEAGIIYSVRKKPKKFSTLDKAVRWAKEEGFSEIEIHGIDYKGNLKLRRN